MAFLKTQSLTKHNDPHSHPHLVEKVPVLDYYPYSHPEQIKYRRAYMLTSKPPQK